MSNSNTDDIVKDIQNINDIEHCDGTTMKSYIPLNFWFSNKTNGFDTIKTTVLKKIDDIMDSIDFDSKDPAYYSNIQDSILNCRYELQKACMIAYPLPIYFQQELDFIENHIRGRVIPR